MYVENIKLKDSRVLVIGDLHLTGKDNLSFRNEEKLIIKISEIIDKNNPEVVIFIGDILEFDLTNTKNFLESKIGKSFVDIFSNPKIKFYILRGNHDPSDLPNLISEINKSQPHLIDIVKLSLNQRQIWIEHGDTPILKSTTQNQNSNLISLITKTSKYWGPITASKPISILIFYLLSIPYRLESGRIIFGKFLNNKLIHFVTSNLKEFSNFNELIFGHTHYFDQVNLENGKKLFFTGLCANGYINYINITPSGSDLISERY